MHFLARNRIIVGLSRLVVVIEAGERSGALITASSAADQGKDVFAVPGNIHAPQSRGTNKLIRDGARPLLEPQDVLSNLAVSALSAHDVARSIVPTNQIEAVILGILSLEPLHIDEICSQVDCSIQDVAAALTIMELKGLVRNTGNRHYVIEREMGLLSKGNV
jgi:DNA processing protein